MKKLLLLASLVISLGATAQDKLPVINGGVGPVTAISSDVSTLPAKAQSFINELFPNVAVAKVTNDVADREYEVDMANGYEVKFNYEGKWLEVDTPDNATFPSSMLPRLMPEAVVIETLTGNDVQPGGIIEFIDEVEVTPASAYAISYTTPVGKGKVLVDKKGKVRSHKAKMHPGHKVKSRSGKFRKDRFAGLIQPVQRDRREYRARLVKIP